MVFDNLKTYLEHRAVHKQEKAANKALRAEAKLQAYVDRCSAEEIRRWGMPTDADQEEEGTTRRAVVHRYQRALGVSQA